jgi:hypothetical protein
LRRWKQESGYSRRSLAETAMMRMMRQKVPFGSGLWSRLLVRQSVECRLHCAAVLNLFTALGMPDSYLVQEAT